MYLKDQKADFCFLQETFSKASDEAIWRNEWGGQIYFSHGTCHSKGVCVLINRAVKEKVTCTFSDTSGRIILINITYNGLKLSLCNIYAPNDHTQQLGFIQELNCLLIDKAEIATLIVGGDWNCTLEKKDKKGGVPWRPTAYRNLVKITMDSLDLVDIQRTRHPKLNAFSYVSKALGVKSRIDFFLVAKHLTKFVKKVDIQTSIAPDHNTICLLLSWPDEHPRGPGFWKFNNTLLDDEEYTSKIRELYPELRKKYSDVKDQQLFWELMKMEIRTVTISFAKGKAQTIKKCETVIKEQLDELDKKICNSQNLDNINDTLKQYDDLKKELQQHYDNKGKAAIFRSKCRWVEEGEKATKYFFNLEKRNYNRKTINEIKLDNEETTTDEKQILSMIKMYYDDLYNSTTTETQDNFETFIENLEIPKLDDKERDELDGPLTYEECKKSLEAFQNGKSPGVDGLTVEFYKHFFDLIGLDLLASLNRAYELGRLSISQRRGIITLLPKEDADLMLLQNWRPITLLNVDYKIASKAIAMRIEPMLPNLVHPDQTGFVKGRYIGENIRLIFDIMEQTKVNNIPGILISVDFKKAFDSLEWSCIQSTLQKFNFGDSLRKWIKIFYTDIESAALNNGFATDWFKPSRGVRQGCPLSPFLFILTAEVLSNKIRQNPTVKGIRLFGSEVKLSQFADDTNLFCGDLASVEQALDIVNVFGKFSGLMLNVEKTKAIWLGKWSKNKTKPLGMKWVNSPTKFLGIFASYDEKGNNQMNFNLKVQKLQTNLDMWNSRGLTLYGKVLIIKSLGLSNLIYSISNTNVPKEIVSTVKDKMFRFLWKNKKDKIKRTSLYQDFSNGGLRMVDIELTIRSLRLAWIQRLIFGNKGNWKNVPDHFFKKHGGLNFLLRCNYDTKYLGHFPEFYRDILIAFDEIKTLYNYDQGNDIILFNNKDILVDGKPIFIREWFNKGIHTIQELLNENGQYLTFQDFQIKYHCKTNFLQFYQILSAIPGFLKEKARTLGQNPMLNYSENYTSFLLNQNTEINLEKFKARDYYHLLLAKKHQSLPTGPKRWGTDLSMDTEDWKEIFSANPKLCKENKLKEFQFKFIHRIVVTKKELFKYGIHADSDCTYCSEPDSIDHTFINCTFTRTFARNVIDWFNVQNGSSFQPDTKEMLFSSCKYPNNPVLERKVNYTLLFMKYYIYTSKLNNNLLCLTDFSNKLNLKYKVENLKQ